MTIVIPITFGLLLTLFVVFSVTAHVLRSGVRRRREKREAVRQLRKQQRQAALSSGITKVRSAPMHLLARVGLRRKESPWVPLRKRPSDHPRQS
jgi:hypothetical protein